MLRLFFFPQFILACMLLLSVLRPAAAEDLIVSRALLLDSAGTLDIQTVAHAHAQFADSGLFIAKGFTDAVHWLRISVRAPQDDEFELRIRPSFLDEVRLYEPHPQRPGEWIVHVTGDRHPNADRPVTALGFMLQSRAEDTTYYLRLHTASSSLLNVVALEPAAGRIADLRRQFLHVIYFCLGMAMGLMALRELLVLRERMTLFFIFYLVTQLSQTLALSGYLAYVLPHGLEHLADLISNLLMIMTIITGIMFYTRLFRSYGASPLAVRLLELLLLVCLVEIIFIGIGNTREALRMNGNIVFAIGLLLMLIALSMRGGAERERRIIQRLVAMQAVALTCTMLPLLGMVSPHAEWILNIGLVHGLITSSVMYTILHFRARGMLEAKKQVELELALTSTMLDAERRRANEQARFMDMLTHELKTPLAAVKMVFGMPDASDNAKQHAMRALDDMDAVVERCRQMDQLEQGGMVPRREVCRVEELVHEIVAGYRSADRVQVVAGELPAVESDHQLLQIILGNLVDNALKYSQPGSSIQLGLQHLQQADGRCIEVAITNLPGSVGAPDPERVFAKYYRAPKAHRYTGSGLGLYLVRSLAELLGGRLAYDYVNPQVRFILWIPV